jgi:hypothetical protein
MKSVAFGVVLNREETKQFVYRNFDKNLAVGISRHDSLETYLIEEFSSIISKFSGRKSFRFYENKTKIMNDVVLKIPLIEDLKKKVDQYIGRQYNNFVYSLKYKDILISDQDSRKDYPYKQFCGLFVGVQLDLLEEDYNYNLLYDYKLLVSEFLSYCTLNLKNLDNRFVICTHNGQYGFL